MLTPDDQGVLAELAPVLRRAVALDLRSLARLRFDPGTASVFVRLPFEVLVSRTIDAPARISSLDLAARAADLLAWLDTPPGEPVVEPQPRDVEWRAGLPPATGWRRIETVPDTVLRPLVRRAALALKEAAAREGVPSAQPRTEVADALLDSVVLTASDGDQTAEVTLRTVSALTRMGFLPRGGFATSMPPGAGSGSSPSTAPCTSSGPGRPSACSESAICTASPDGCRSRDGLPVGQLRTHTAVSGGSSLRTVAEECTSSPSGNRTEAPPALSQMARSPRR